MNNPLLILYLEDNLRDAELVRDKLQQIVLPHELRIASDRAEFEAALAQTRFDLILSDYALPDYDGMAALALAREKQPDVPFILVSGMLGEERAVDCVVRGATDYVLKQNLNRLVLAVLRALTGAEEHQKRRVVEEALLESEERNRVLIENSHDIIYTLTPDGVLDFVSRAWTTFLGHTAKQVTGFPLRSFIHPDDLAGCEVFLKSVIETGERKSGVEYRVKHSNGSWYWHSTSACPLKDAAGNVIGLEGVARDITESKRAEVKLQESNALTEAIVENIPLMILLKEATDLRFVIFNRAGEELLGYDRKALLGKNNLDLFPPGQAANFMAKDREVLDGESGMLDILEEPIQTAKKGKRLLHTRKVCIRGADGTTKYLLAISEDITDRKQAEENLRTMNIQLQKSLEELKLAQQKVIQQERLSALGQMASGIAHDFNNVLMPIIGFSELLTSDPAALDDRKEAKHMLEMIHSAGNDARRIVHRLRAVYKKEDDASYELVDISKVTESAISLTMPKWKGEMHAKGVTIEMATRFAPVPQIMGNVSELRETITNLIFNAVDAMPGGGVITFSVERLDSAEVSLDITDTGLGMDHETLQHCLEPFYTTKGAQGSGLGLSMVHGIVERHHGVMEIKSQPGAGTTVRMRFPVPDNQEKVIDGTEKEVEKLPPLQILVVDDEERSRDLIGRLLNNDGHQTVMASGGKEAIERLRKNRFDLLITDRAMPSMRGDTVARKAKEIQPGIPIIMLTGFGEIMKEIGEKPSCVTKVMSKPVTATELRDVMVSVLKKA